MNLLLARRVNPALSRPTARHTHPRIVLRIASAAAMCTCTLTLASCGSPPTPESPAAQGKPAASASTGPQSGTADRQSPFAAPPAHTAAIVSGADNYEDLLKYYPQAEQSRIRVWIREHADGSMAFRSNAQWKWMQQHAYPTPDDVLRASTMSEAQLHDLAAQGDTKANFFYLTRLLDDYARTGAAPAASSRDRTRLQTEMTASMDRALASGSAFAGYLFGGYYAALHGKQAGDIGHATGAIWADSLGDSNAVFLNPQATMGFPGVSGVRAAEVYFDMFAAAARVNPYFLNARRSQGELFIPLSQ